MSNYDNSQYLSLGSYTSGDLRRSNVKGAYSSSATRDPEVQDLKQKYGIRSSSKNIDKYPDSYGKTNEIKKVPEEISNLRATYNGGSKSSRPQNYDRFDREDDFNREDLFKSSVRNQRQKPEVNLRHTYNSKNYDRIDQDVSMPTIRRNSQKDDYKYEIKVNPTQHSTGLINLDSDPNKIDFDRINEKLQNNVAMITELKRLKEERKMRKQGKALAADTKDYDLLTPSTKEDKYADRLGVSETKRIPSKSFDIEPRTPKYKERTDVKELEISTKPTMQRSKSNYLMSEKKQRSTTPVKQSTTPTKIKSTTPTKLSVPQKSATEVRSAKDLVANKEPTKIVGDFILEKNLGQGKFGVVFRAFHKQTGAIFAIKKVPKKMIKSHFMIDQFILELKIQSYFEHRNILKIFGFFDDADSIYLILEYMEEGTLFTYFKKNKTLTEKDAAKKVRDISEAIKECHESGVAHRDIKPQNIVMSYGVCKLCDFGWATICTDRRKTYCGTFDYAAPQILEGQQYDMSVDEWCIGVLAYELMVGKAPFYHISRKQTMKKIMNAGSEPLEFPKQMTKTAISFIEKLVVKNPDDRMKADQILKHEFLKVQDVSLD